MRTKVTPKLNILIGVPGSGKTTLALECLKQNSNLIRVNRDDIRKMIRDDYNPGQEFENLVSSIQDSTINSEQLLDLNAQQIIELRSQYQNNQFACAASVLDNPTLSTNPAKVFPNPTNGIIQIQSSSPLNSIRILNITGTEIMRCTNCKEVNLSSLRAGIYVMEYETNGKKYVEKIVKQ